MLAAAGRIIKEGRKGCAVLLQGNGQGAQFLDILSFPDPYPLEAAMIMNCPFFSGLPCTAGRR